MIENKTHFSCKIVLLTDPLYDENQYCPKGGSMFGELLANYIYSTEERPKIHRPIWLPFTNLGVHLIEMDEKHIGKTLPFENQITNITDKLRRKNPQAPNAPLLETSQNNLALIDAWRKLFFLSPNDEEVVLLRNTLYAEGVTEEDLYAAIYEKVLEGNFTKRKFRVHFLNVQLPLTICMDHIIHTTSVILVSASCEALHIKIDGVQKKRIENATNLHLTLCPTELFKSYDDRLSQEIKFLHNFTNTDNEFVPKRSASLEIDIDQIGFRQNHIEYFNHMNSPNIYEYMHIPYSALNDDILLKEASTTDHLTESINQLEESLYKMIS